MSDEELNELRKLIQAPHAISRRDLDLIYPGYYASLSLSLSEQLPPPPRLVSQRRIWLIYPFSFYKGTKWCGAGNDAATYDDLGTAEEVDMCCREHDHCDMFIEAGQSKYGLTNNGDFTRQDLPLTYTF